MFDGQPKELIIYETATGAQPFIEWLRGLRDRAGQARIRARLERLEQLGNPGDYKSVGTGVYELRIDFGPGYRVYLGLTGQQLVLLLCGGDKSTQARDVAQAQTYWRDYQQRQA
jgi:putative addiction module killer protein